MRLTHSFHIRPTGKDGSYRRTDFLRGAGIAALSGVLLAAIAWIASIASVGIAVVVAFLAGLCVVVAAILIIQAVLGSALPVSFLAPPDSIPPGLRDRLHRLLRDHWVSADDLLDEDISVWAVHGLTAELYDYAARGATVHTLEGVIERFEQEQVSEAKSRTDRRSVAELFQAAVLEYHHRAPGAGAV